MRACFQSITLLAIFADTETNTSNYTMVLLFETVYGASFVFKLSL